MPPAKSTTTTGARRKSAKGTSHIIVLKLSPENLRTFDPLPVKEEVKEEKEETPVKDSPPSSNSNTLPVASSNEDNKSESNVDTPIAAGTPVPSTAMPPPPIEGSKKKGTKRNAAVALGPDGLPIPKVRGKPGPKKKARLEDGSIDHSSTTPRAPNGTAHKLGPKANQGAINAGLRALDRSGKPCRKWQKGGFVLKSFTGVVWEIPRWKAPPKFGAEGVSEGSASGDSSKENKRTDSQVESEKSNDKSNMGIEAESSPVPSAPSAAPAPATTEPVITAAQSTHEVAISA